MPWPRKTSTCRSFVTISSGLCRLFAIVVLLHGQNHTSRWTRSMGVDHDTPEETELHEHVIPGSTGGSLLLVERRIVLPASLGKGIVRAVVAVDRAEVHAAGLAFA